MNGRDDATIRRTLVDHAGGAPLATLVSELRLATSGWECDPDVANALAAVRKLGADVSAALTPEELSGLEAIVLPRLRPVAFVRGRSFDALPAPWLHLQEARLRARLAGVFPSIGRVEALHSPAWPFVGTGLVVGPDLFLTNRHVAAVFTVGLGDRNLGYHAGDAAINFGAEVDGGEDELVPVREVILVHPYWDVAVLRVDPLPASRPPLPLGTRGASGLVGRDVATIGHPVRDERGDILLQDRVFSRRYNVKRLQPGKILGSAAVRSFGREVVAMTHDCSTLGGNSGSPVCDLESGEIVGLHFAGQQFVANYSVPTAALASDPRLAPLGLTFVGDPPPSAPAVDLCVAEAWRLLG